eukprot:NODE_1469_length_594_cov_569.264220_g1174_i0.p1 GENE.NODE_1469_length_594_cov_569.264220_g1174_i0~~NODE_1469_length_594_cov_569.264220_g1174_i0.p1  ORF type:complete len:173 (+),score=23.92 NODE_1469_length_594_cov_569.264220_g1174_i0:30-521(+)
MGGLPGLRTRVPVKEQSLLSLTTIEAVTEEVVSKTEHLQSEINRAKYARDADLRAMHGGVRQSVAVRGARLFTSLLSFLHDETMHPEGRGSPLQVTRAFPAVSTATTGPPFKLRLSLQKFAATCESALELTSAVAEEGTNEAVFHAEASQWQQDLLQLLSATS